MQNMSLETISVTFSLLLGPTSRDECLALKAKKINLTGSGGAGLTL